MTDYSDKNALPSVKLCSCGYGCIWENEQDSYGPCWGFVEAVGEDYWIDECGDYRDVTWIHSCEGHSDIDWPSGEGKWKKPPANRLNK
jgi:hypothetical protein